MNGDEAGGGGVLFPPNDPDQSEGNKYFGKVTIEDSMMTIGAILQTKILHVEDVQRLPAGRLFHTFFNIALSLLFQ
jgi:hypothetical protein